MKRPNEVRQERLRRLRPKIEDYELPAEARRDRDRPRNQKERQALVERLIQEAIEEGAFDNLPGHGKPLDLTPNPYLESGQELAFGLLKNNGFAPEWIERDKEIRREFKAARDHLRLAWQNWRGQPAWQAAVARFEQSLDKLNRKIDDFNLLVPIVSCQRSRLRLDDEVRRIQQEDRT